MRDKKATWEIIPGMMVIRDEDGVTGQLVRLADDMWGVFFEVEDEPMAAQTTYDELMNDWRPHTETLPAKPLTKIESSDEFNTDSLDIPEDMD